MTEAMWRLASSLYLGAMRGATMRNHEYRAYDTQYAEKASFMVVSLFAGWFEGNDNVMFVSVVDDEK